MNQEDYVNTIVRNLASEVADKAATIAVLQAQLSMAKAENDALKAEKAVGEE